MASYLITKLFLRLVLSRHRDVHAQGDGRRGSGVLPDHGYAAGHL